MDWTVEHAMDHVVLVLFENRSFDNLLGHLYSRAERPEFEGVEGRTFSNPVPDWEGLGPLPDTEPGRRDGRVHFASAGPDEGDVPNPDPGEEFPHTNTQIYGVVAEGNRFRSADQMMDHPNLPAAGAEATMEGFVTDYISHYRSLRGELPTYEQYKQIMRGLTPDHVPVLSTIAKGYAVFDHWFSEVPSQTFPNRSFWTAATSSGAVLNSPMSHWYHDNDAPTLFDLLDQRGLDWKVYVLDSPLSITGAIHHSRLDHAYRDRFVPYEEFEEDVQAGTLPAFSLIEPNLLAGHGDYHPPMGDSMAQGVKLPVDWVQPVDAGERFLARVYNAFTRAPVEGAPEDGRSCAWNSMLFIGWDEPGGTYDHVAPPPAVPPGDGSTSPVFDFTRSGYRVPAVLVSPWVEPGTIVGAPTAGPPTLQYRHTSLLNTLRHRWGLDGPLTGRDADDSAATFEGVFTRSEPRRDWPAVPIPAEPEEGPEVTNEQFFGSLGRHLVHGLAHIAHRDGRAEPGVDAGPDAFDPHQYLPYTPIPLPTGLFDSAVRAFAWSYFPKLRGNRDAVGADAPTGPSVPPGSP